jgi:hypothetical protein
MAGLLISILLVVAAVVIVAFVGHQPPTTSGGGSAPNIGGQRIAAETAARNDAVAWVTSQVGRDVTLACDAVTCNDLAEHGFPAGNLDTLQPAAPDPYGSQLVIATADIRSQFGTKLASTYAPEVIASFGAGADRIDIRVMAPQGPAAFFTALTKDLAARRSSGAELISNKNIVISAPAKAELAAGQIDLRLLTSIAFLAGQRPVQIVGFGSYAPGAGPGVPLRFAYLAETDKAAGADSSGYLQSLLAVLHAEVYPYVPMSIGTVRLADGQAVLRIEFSAPSLLGLLKS